MRERLFLGKSGNGNANVKANHWFMKSRSLLLLHRHEEIEVSWFADGETEAQRDGMTCLRIPSRQKLA